MKNFLKTSLIIALCLTLTACSVQKRAERHIRKAVALCPELVQTTAHPIDTVLTVQGFADATYIPLHDILSGDTLYKATEHGTFLVSMDRKTSEIRVGFIAAPRHVRLTDTVHYAQVAYMPHAQQAAKGTPAWVVFVGIIVGVAVGIIVIVYVFLYKVSKIQE